MKKKLGLVGVRVYLLYLIHFTSVWYRQYIFSRLRRRPDGKLGARDVQILRIFNIEDIYYRLKIEINTWYIQNDQPYLRSRALLITTTYTVLHILNISDMVPVHTHVQKLLLICPSIVFCLLCNTQHGNNFMISKELRINLHEHVYVPTKVLLQLQLPTFQMLLQL